MQVRILLTAIMYTLIFTLHFDGPKQLVYGVGLEEDIEAKFGRYLRSEMTKRDFKVGSGVAHIKQRKVHKADTTYVNTSGIRKPVKSICGQLVHKDFTADDSNEITCVNCRSKLKKKAHNKDQQELRTDT